MRRPRDRLAEYREKRDFARTPEPPAESSQTAPAAENKKALAFVVQKHDATRLHYDVRLEIDGAMMSFAVPKGPSYDPKIRRLAVETEDHPMSYNAFEGRIPDGEYGAGDVLLWDRGTYETVPPGQQAAMREKGHLHVVFHGEKLRGGWHLVRTKGDGARARDRDDGTGRAGKAAWLMTKANDATADPSFDVVEARPESVVSGRTATRGPRRVGASREGGSAQALLAAVGDVARATATRALDEPSRYWLEIKYDGYRMLLAKAGGDVRLASRNGRDWTAPFRAIAERGRALAVREAVIDGEVCATLEDGRPSFEALQATIAGERTGAHLAYVAFDLLWVDGRDLRARPIEERRELLEPLIAGVGAPFAWSRALDGAGDVRALLDAAKRAGLEGLVAKRKGSPYAPGASASWLKIKFTRRQDCVIVGWIPQDGTKDRLGALLLGVNDGGALRYAGRVGTGFDARTRALLLARLDALRTRKAAIPIPRTPGAIFCAPSLVCEVAFGEWTRDGSMRRPSFVALRDDKGPEECALEEPAAATTPDEPARGEASTRGEATTRDEPARSRATTRGEARTTAASASAAARAVRLANPEKVLFPRDGITKRDVCEYYTQIAPLILPHLAARPLTLQRWPHGIDGEAWYQQNAPDDVPDFVRLVSIPGEAKKRRIVAENVASLQWLANLAALTLHGWSARVPTLDRPDYVVLDLDPGEGTWRQLVDVALAVRALLEALEMPSAVKTSGKRGLHVVVPIAAGPTHDEATAFAERVAKAVAQVLPKIATVERRKEKRGGRLYVDYLQNGFGKTIVAPYTIRALDGAPVSTPIAWSEVTPKLDPKRFTIRTVLERVGRTGDLFAVARAGRTKLPPAR